jgi:hypothetical protein
VTVRFEGKIDSVAMRRVRNAIATTPARVYPKLRDEMTRWGRQWERAVQDRFTGTTGAQSLHGRTGQLQKSLSFKVDGGSIADLHLRCQSAGVNYARQREYGGEIKPKNKRFLTIPTDANKSAAGVARKTVGQLIAEFGKNRVAFVTDRGANRGVVLLKDTSVATKGKAGLRHTLNKNAPGKCVAMFWLTRKVDQPGPRSPSHKAESRLGFFDEWKKLGQSRRAGLDRLGREIGRAS